MTGLLAAHEQTQILVDMDGVIANLDAAIEKELQAKRPSLRPVRPRSNFYIMEDYPAAIHGLIESIFRTPGLYRHLDVVKGALNGWYAITEAGYQPRICSSILPENPTCQADKLSWLEEHMVPHFGYSIISEAIFDRDKSKYPALALIDDKPEIRVSQPPLWTHIVFDAPYNQNSSSPIRLYGWDDPNLTPLLDYLRSNDEAKA
ncbi:MAG TPA: hypothetical protein VLG37_02045 [Candidatus Saccharimonadales bacterium]|nr:hypothetical protein [Candidatus Saccharimonadales bacterium]